MSGGSRAAAHAASSPADGPGQLGLGHLGAALDALALGIGVQLLLGAPLRPAVRPQAATATGRDVVGRRTALLLGLAVQGAFLVHRAGRDLLRGVLAAA